MSKSHELVGRSGRLPDDADDRLQAVAQAYVDSIAPYVLQGSTAEFLEGADEIDMAGAVVSCAVQSVMLSKEGRKLRADMMAFTLGTALASIWNQCRDAEISDVLGQLGAGFGAAMDRLAEGVEVQGGTA